MTAPARADQWPALAEPEKSETKETEAVKTFQNSGIQLSDAGNIAQRLTSDAGKPVSDNRALDDDTTGSISKADRRIILLVARASSISELAGKTVAINADLSGQTSDIRPAIVAAGAIQVILSESETAATDRLGSDEVAAAVLGVLSPAAAEAFPDISGYRIFRIPVSP